MTKESVPMRESSISVLCLPAKTNRCTGNRRYPSWESDLVESWASQRRFFFLSSLRIWQDSVVNAQLRCLSPEWALASIIGNENRESDLLPVPRRYSLGARVRFSILSNSTIKDYRTWYSAVACSTVTVVHALFSSLQSSRKSMTEKKQAKREWKKTVKWTISISNESSAILLADLLFIRWWRKCADIDSHSRYSAIQILTNLWRIVSPCRYDRRKADQWRWQLHIEYLFK